MANDVTALRKFLEADAVIGQLQKAMPGNLSAGRLVRQVITLVQSNPALLECSQISILAGCMQAAELGLELTGPLGHAYLVPRWDKRQRCKAAVFQVGWKGLVNLAFRSGRIASFPVRTVHANDVFMVEYGTSQRIIHQPTFSNRGEPIGYYALVVYKGGGNDFEYMTREEVQAHRVKYEGGQGWDRDFDAMAQKTVVRKLCRRLSMCPEAQAAAMQEEYEEAEVLPRPALPQTGTRTATVMARMEEIHSLPAPTDEGNDESATEEESLSELDPT